MVAAGVVVGAIVETDCASVSIGERTSRRNPYPAAGELDWVGFSIKGRPFFLLDSNENKGGYDTGLVDSVQGTTVGEADFSFSRSCQKQVERRRWRRKLPS
jgi:hypothetical protein